MRISDLQIYPIKSCGPASLGRCNFDHYGIQGDRRIILADLDGGFMSQRNPKARKLARVSIHRVRWLANEVLIGAADVGRILVPTRIPSELLGGPDLLPHTPISIHGREAWGWDVGDEVADWFSTFLGMRCRAYLRHPNCPRITGANHTEHRMPLNFQDGSHILLTSSQSLAALNRGIVEGGGAPVPMSRFRPNIVVDGDIAPFEEDTWKRVRIGNSILAMTHRCERCPVPIVDQKTGELTRGGEPFKTLKSMQPGQRKPTFGVNLMVLEPGGVCTGGGNKEVEVLERWVGPVPTNLS